MVYSAGSGKCVPVDWDTAFVLIAQHLRALPDSNQAIFYTSSHTSSEAAFLCQLLVRAYGINNFPDCSNMYHEPFDTGIQASIGIGKGTTMLDDFTKIDVTFIFGQNPEANHLRILSELHEAPKRGVSIMSLNPPRERGLERFVDP